jgi:DNA-binding NtrC family response regulator
MVTTARRILVVDDEPVVNQSCRRVLGEAGYDVHTTESGRDGLTQACTQEFDLVITDLKMPDLDGMNLIRQLKEQRPDTVIIVITGYGTVSSAVEATRLGVADYIEKPFTPEELSQAVVGALAGTEEAATTEIDADLVRQVLLRAAKDRNFGVRLLSEGTRVLSGLGLSSEAQAAVASGDIVWIEKRCGELSAEERDWLTRRLQAETW